MSLYEIITLGAQQAYEAAEGMLNKAVSDLGADKAIAYPDTAYFQSVIYGPLGKKCKTLGELAEVLPIIKSLMSDTPRLEAQFNNGIAVALAAEVIEATKYATMEAPYTDPAIGFVPDPIIRQLGVPLVTGDIPGVAVVLGKAPSKEEAGIIIKDLQAKGIMTFLIGEVIDQAIEAEVKMGVEMRVVPIGYDVTSVIHVVSVAIRAALIFGGVPAGNMADIFQYTKDRVPAFVIALGELTPLIVGAGAGAIKLGFPVIADKVPPLMEVPMCLINQPDYSKMVATALEARNIKIKITDIPIPVAFAPAFEGERIRREQLYCMSGGNKSISFEVVRTLDASEIEDHKIEVIGGDIDDLPEGSVFHCGIVIDVAGKKMQSDFEPVIERRLHYFFNYCEGIMHVGQRDINMLRISKDAFGKGFRLHHFGEAIYAKILDEFASIIDKVQVTIYTEEKQAQEKLESIARELYHARDNRLKGLSDEATDTFYSCILCQSFAPSHVCIVTPERLGLCGAVSWLDAKATYEIDPTGPCQPVPKGDTCDDELKGIYPSINQVVNEMSHGAIERMTMYSIMEDPMTSCGCFECICAIMPEANGVVIVNREFKGDSPVGMGFSTLAGMTGGGVQTPGFMGHGRQFIVSKKFLGAEGGIARLVWMPKELKEALKDDIDARGKEIGCPDLYDKIADETVGQDSETVCEFLNKVGHPALAMDPMM